MPCVSTRFTERREKKTASIRAVGLSLESVECPRLRHMSPPSSLEGERKSKNDGSH